MPCSFGLHSQHSSGFTQMSCEFSFLLLGPCTSIRHKHFYIFLSSRNDRQKTWHRERLIWALCNYVQLWFSFISAGTIRCFCSKGSVGFERIPWFVGVLRRHSSSVSEHILSFLKVACLSVAPKYHSCCMVSTVMLYIVLPFVHTHLHV